MTFLSRKTKLGTKYKSYQTAGRLNAFKLTHNAVLTLLTVWIYANKRMQNKRISMQKKIGIHEIIERGDRVNFKNEDVEKEKHSSSSKH